MNDYSEYIAQLYDRQEQRQRPDGLSAGAMASAYYEGSDWLNFGYWRDDTTGVTQACENLVDELMALSPNAGGLILDVGCGKGMTARHLAKNFDAENIFGINVSREHLERCALNAPQSTFLEMDATQMDFPDESFERIISVEAAFHFNTRVTFFKEAFRILRPGGTIVLSDILTDVWTPHQPLENRISDIESYEALFGPVGFSDVRVVDATKECVVGFHQAVLRFFQARAAKGEIGEGMLERVTAMSKKGAAKKQIYVLAAATKPA